MTSAEQTLRMTRLRHLLDLLSPARRTRIVDIGANPIDVPPYQRLVDADACEVWGFEPQQKAYERLVAAAGPHQHYLPHAVGDGTMGVLHVSPVSGFTSMLPPNEDFVRATGLYARGLVSKEQVEMQTRRLDDLDLPQPDLVKIDIQGGESAVFRNGRKVLTGARAVITEVSAVPLYRDQPLLDAQMRDLGECGYFLHKFLFFKQRRLSGTLAPGVPPRLRSQLVDGDAVFVRSLLSLRDEPDEALKHLAILADGAFESLDLAAMVVGLLAERGSIASGSVASYVALLQRS